MRAAVLDAVSAERDRQETLWAGDHGWGVGSCASEHVDERTKLAVLLEEVGEVARALLERDRASLRVELTQVAAVSVAWLESLGPEAG